MVKRVTFSTLLSPLIAHWVSSDATRSAMMKGLPHKWPIPGVDHVVVVASGKGGVGKSTAVRKVLFETIYLTLPPLSAPPPVCSSYVYSSHFLQNLQVGLLDADVFGPSIPRLMNLSEQPELTKRQQPHHNSSLC